jgi:hypothetical protein
MESAGAWRHLTAMIGLFVLCCHSVLFERRAVAAGFNKPSKSTGSLCMFAANCVILSSAMI